MRYMQKNAILITMLVQFIIAILQKIMINAIFALSRKQTALTHDFYRIFFIKIAILGLSDLRYQR